MIPVTSLGEMGSSPHARGARRTGGGAVDHAGIIPACAGSTSSTRLIASSSGDHPRMRGEHSCTTLRDVPILGSSPHARGARIGTL